MIVKMICLDGANIRVIHDTGKHHLFVLLKTVSPPVIAKLKFYFLQLVPNIGLIINDHMYSGMRVITPFQLEALIGEVINLFTKNDLIGKLRHIFYLFSYNFLYGQN